MKTAALTFLVALAFSSSAFAILRPRFPHRPMPPYGGQSIIIVEDSAPNSASIPPAK